MQIKDRKINANSEPFIIAEVGINHNGELDKMLEMIEVAKNSGCDCVKFQTFKSAEFVGDKNQTYTYISQGKEITEPMYKMFERVEVKEEYWSIIKNKCDELNIIFMSTPQNKTDLDILLSIEIPAIKVGSDDFVNLPLLRSYKETKLPIILSCGMADFEEVKKTLKIFNSYPVALLLCTSQYPTPLEDVNLNKLITLRDTFPGLILGFSDHTQGTIAATTAVGMGAKIFEKHFTLSKNLKGPDHWFSSEPNELKLWVTSIKDAYKALGTFEIKPTKSEIKMKPIARRKICAKTNINVGTIYTECNLNLKRANNGLEVSFYDTIIGKKATRNILENEPIEKDDFE